jgi:hypothetical protein
MAEKRYWEEDNMLDERRPRLMRQPPHKKYISTEDAELERAEREGPLGVINEIKEDPIPIGVNREVICGTPIDWHAIEDFTVSISPYKFVTLMKLNKQILREQLMKYAKKPSQISGKFLIMLLVIGGLAILGIVVIMYLPKIIAMFGG